MASPVVFPREEAPEYDITNLPPPESSKDKFWRKMKEQPAVPIGEPPAHLRPHDPKPLFADVDPLRTPPPPQAPSSPAVH